MFADHKKEDLKLFMLVPVLFAGKIKYLLRDDFLDDKAAGSLLGTPADPGPGTRVGQDTGDKMSTSGEKLLISRQANYDPKFALDAVTREAGRLMVGHIKLSNQANRYQMGWAVHTGAGQVEMGVMSVGIELRTPTNQRIGNVYADRDYYLAMVLKAAGAYVFIKEITGSPAWVFYWMSTANSTATLYAIIGVQNAWGAGNNEHEMLRVPLSTWLPTPLIYDLFTGANGTSLDAHGSDTAGPESQPVGSLTGVEQSGDWDIQSNRANPDGAGMHSWELGKANIFFFLKLNGGTAGGPGMLMRYTDTENYWYLQADRANNRLEIHEVNATVDTVRANAAVAINDSTDYVISGYCHAQSLRCFIDGLSAIAYGTAALNEGATKHGLFSDNSDCKFDNLLVFVRNGDYKTLDSFL